MADIQGTQNMREITYKELMKHNNSDSCWVVIDKNVYDVSGYLAYHPGGAVILAGMGGKDASTQFTNRGHSEFAISIRDNMKIGWIEDGPVPEECKSSVKVENMQSLPYVTYQELKTHDKKEDLWVEIDGLVYDLSNFANEHPGGPQILANRAGKIATEGFKEVGHSEQAVKLMKEMLVGRINVSNDYPSKEQLEIKEEKINPMQIALILAALAFALIFARYFSQ